MNLQGNGHHFYGVSRTGAGAYRAMKEIQEQQQQREHDARKQAAAPVNPVDEARKLARALMNRVGMTDYGRFWDSVSDSTSAEQDLLYLQMMTRYIESEGDFDKAFARFKQELSDVSQSVLMEFDGGDSDTSPADRSELFPW